jgi:glycosyltransferase involved in cell wall biosynthesis
VGGVHGVLVGDGPMLPAVRALAAARGMAERMTFTGMVANASRYLAAFDMLALTSHTEGTPMVLLEAMWAGVPIVATAVGGVPDVVGPEAALLCPAGDAAAIGRALAELSHDPTDGGRRESLRRAARTRVATEFDPGAWLGAHEATYRRALSALTGTRYPIEYC